MEVQYQGVKEETFIQTGRRGGNGQLVWKGLAARWQLEDQGRGIGGGQSHICMLVNWEEKLGNKTDHTTKGSSVGK